VIDAALATTLQLTDHSLLKSRPAMCASALHTTLHTAHCHIQIGVKDALVLSPTLMPGTGPVSGTSTSTGLGVSAQATSARMVLLAACGAQHTVLVTHSGGVLVCGRNRYYTALLIHRTPASCLCLVTVRLIASEQCGSAWWYTAQYCCV
jgi:hypothetical protein